MRRDALIAKPRSRRCRCRQICRGHADRDALHLHAQQTNTSDRYTAYTMPVHPPPGCHSIQLPDVTLTMTLHMMRLDEIT